jgi:hypothetical protein
MRYRVLAHFVIEARDDAHAVELAKKFEALLKHPMVRMAIDSEGIRLAEGNGRPVVYSPQREG